MRRKREWKKAKKSDENFSPLGKLFYENFSPIIMGGRSENNSNEKERIVITIIIKIFFRCKFRKYLLELCENSFKMYVPSFPGTHLIYIIFISIKSVRNNSREIKTQTLPPTTQTAASDDSLHNPLKQTVANLFYAGALLLLLRPSCFVFCREINDILFPFLAHSLSQLRQTLFTSFVLSLFFFLFFVIQLLPM